MTKYIQKLNKIQNKELQEYFEKNYSTLQKEGSLTKTTEEMAKQYGVCPGTLITNIVGPIGKIHREPPKLRPKSNKSIISYTDEECGRLRSIFEALNSPARNKFYEHLKSSKVMGTRLASRTTVDRALERAGSNISTEEKQLRKDKVISLWKAGNTIEVIAKALPEIAEQTIKVYLREFGISLDTSATTEFKKEVLSHYYEFGTQKTIEVYNVPQNTQSRWRQEFGWSSRDNGESHREYQLNESFFSLIDKESKAHHLGLYATDGNVTRNIIGLELQRRDEDMLKIIKTSVATNKPLYPTLHYSKESANYHEGIKLALISTTMTKDLSGYGIVPNKSLTLEIDLSLIPTELLRHFWRGCVDGDGWVYSGARLQVGLCGSLKMMEDFAAYLRTVLGIRETVVKHHSIWKVVIDSEKISLIVLHHFYNDSAIFLKRKNLLLLEKNESPNDVIYQKINSDWFETKNKA